MPCSNAEAYTADEVSPLLQQLRTALDSARAKTKSWFDSASLAIRRAFIHSKAGWYRLTAGMEIDELWTQFKVEAGESSRLYKQDVEPTRRPRRSFLEAPFQRFSAISLPASSPNSPPHAACSCF